MVVQFPVFLVFATHVFDDLGLLLGPVRAQGTGEHRNFVALVSYVTVQVSFSAVGLPAGRTDKVQYVVL